MRGVETAGPILDGVEPVGRQGLARRKHDPVQPLRRKPFHRVAVDGVDHGLGLALIFGHFLYRRRAPTGDLYQAEGLFKLEE